MKKIEVIQPSKMVSAYGGVGSIIETVSNGSLLLSPYNQWYCFKGSHIKPLEIKDDRLLQHIQKGCKPIRRIYYIPTDDIGGSKSYNPSSDTKKSAISSEFFQNGFTAQDVIALKHIRNGRKVGMRSIQNRKRIRNSEIIHLPAASVASLEEKQKGKLVVSLWNRYAM